MTAAERKALRRGKRPRYVLFESESHGALCGAYASLRANPSVWVEKPPSVIETRGQVTIIRVFHKDLETAKTLLNSVAGVRTLRTSGTLRALRRKAGLK
ncbi:MAG: hypothetical protein V1934_05055 [Methanobacteriota archaeon]